MNGSVNGGLSEGTGDGMKRVGTGLAEKWSEALASAPRAPAPGWLRELRDTAADQFRAGGLPHRKVEAWRYTPMGVFEAFEVAPAAETLTGASAVGPETQPPLPVCDRATIVDIRNGVLLAPPANLPQGVTVLRLADGLGRFEERLRPLFESVELAGATRAFAALNTVLARQGLVVHVAEGADAGRLLLRWVFSAGATASMNHFRLFLLIDDKARLDLVEQFMGSWGSVGPDVAGLNVLSQAELGVGAQLTHVRVQAESDRAVLVTSTSVEQGADSRYFYRGFDLGARLARHELNVRLSGPGAAADLAGAYLLDGERHTDNYISVEHQAPGCRSEQFFRGVLGGRSRGVFNGRALIQSGADGSSVRQSNANLLLSPLAEIDSKPELEIYADEVEASHGATVGQLDEAAVFYLRSRGLDETAARQLLTTAFCRAVTDRVEGRGLAERIAELMDAAMPVSEL